MTGDFEAGLSGRVSVESNSYVFFETREASRIEQRGLSVDMVCMNARPEPISAMFAANPSRPPRYSPL